MNPLARCAAFLVLLALSAPATAQLVTGRFSTAFYAWEKYDTVKTSSTYWRAFQNVQLTVGQRNVSLHTYIQGAMNASSQFGDRGRLRVFNLYLRWADIFKAVDLSLGRQAIFAGVGNGTIDGLQAKLRLFGDALSVTAYGGATVVPELGRVRSDFKDNSMMGAQVLLHPLSSLRLGLSYVNRHQERDPYWAVRVRDTSYAPVLFLVENPSEADQYASADAAYNWGSKLSLYGRFDYDLNLEKASRAEVSARVGLVPGLALTGFYIHRVPRIDYTSIFWVFPVTSVDEIEGGLEYSVSRYVRAFGRFANVAYTDDKSHRWTIGVNANYASLSYSGSDGYAGQLQSFSAQGAYPVFENTVIPTLGVSVVSYRLSSQQSDRDLAFSLAFGATFRPSRTFSFDAQWQMLHNKVTDGDGRLMVKLNYWFAERLPFFGQEGK